MRKTLFAILLALALVLIPVGSAFADTTATVTVTATPAQLSISLGATGTWEVNGIAVPGTPIKRSITYYSNPLGDTTAPANPVVDAGCKFQVTNDGDVDANITINMDDFAGTVMTNGELGYTTSGATSFGASFYISGGAWPVGAGEILMKPGFDTAFLTPLASGANKWWGVALKTQTDSFLSDVGMTGSINLTAAEA